LSYKSGDRFWRGQITLSSCTLDAVAGGSKGPLETERTKEKKGAYGWKGMSNGALKAAGTIVKSQAERALVHLARSDAEEEGNF